MNREVHARICESVGVKLPRRYSTMVVATIRIKMATGSSAPKQFFSINKPFSGEAANQGVFTSLMCGQAR